MESEWFVKMCLNRAHEFTFVFVCVQKKQINKLLNKWHFDRRQGVFSLWREMATSLHPSSRDVWCISVNLSVWYTHIQTEMENSRMHTFTHTHNKEAVNQRPVRGRKQTAYSVPWYKSLNCGLGAAERALCVTRYRYRLSSVTHK